MTQDNLVSVVFVACVFVLIAALCVFLRWRDTTWFQFREHEANEDQPTYSIQLAQYRNEVKRRTQGRRHRAKRY